MLGDQQNLAWTNLGLWHSKSQNYQNACQNLAQHLAYKLQIQSYDVVLDLGCGQGASLVFWQNEYCVEHIEAVEIQKECVVNIQKQSLTSVKNIYHASFLELYQLSLTQKFSVVVCIDAVYHSSIHVFLAQTQNLLQPKGRIGIHLLILSPKWKNLSALKKYQYKLLLKTADVSLDDLMTKKNLIKTFEAYGFDKIEVTDLSKEVLFGFSEYIASKSDLIGLDGFKIKMTAKLCQKIYQDGLIQYVLLNARH